MPSLRALVASILRVPEDTITDSMTMQNSEAWDSLRHMELILAIEREWNITFAPQEIAGLTSIAAIERALAAHSA